MTPVRALHVGPPLEVIVQRHFVVGRRKDNRARDQVLRRRSRKLFFRRRAFRDRHVTSRFHEPFEFLVSHRRLIYPKAVHAHAMQWLRVVRRHRHLGIAIAVCCRPHQKLTAWNPDHSLRGTGLCLFRGIGPCRKHERAREDQ